MPTHGTCVIGRFTDASAFVSVEHDGSLCAKTYDGLDAAIAEARQLGLIDQLLAVAASLYIAETHRHCVSAVTRKPDARELRAIGYRRPQQAMPNEALLSHV